MRIAVLVLLAGCWSSRGVPAPAPVAPAEPSGGSSLALRNTHHGVSPCVGVVAHAIDVSRAEIDRVPALRDHLEDLRDAATESCVQTAWSSEALQCYGDAATSVDLGSCNKFMTSEQSEDLNRRLLEVMGANAPQPAPTAPPPPPTP